MADSGRLVLPPRRGLPVTAATGLALAAGPGANCRGPEQHFLYCYIFLIATNRRTSGSDLTATTPSAAPTAAMVIAVTYPSVRITFLLLSGGPRH